MPNFPYRTTAVAAALLVGAVAVSQPAEARSRAPAIIAGIAAGAIIAGIASNHHRRRYYEPPRAYYYAPPAPRRYYAPPVSYSHSYAPSYSYGHSYAPAPWTEEWYAYCAHKYRSFHPRSGTFQPYRGPRRLCR